MKERQRWRPEEDSLLRAYVKQYGPRDWHLVSERMNQTLNRDAKSCLERWKNYLKPGIKKGSLTEDEQRLVINLQAKHGNKWKKIAAEVPGRTAKRLGKWWEVFKEKQQREEQKEHKPIETGKYDHILETFAEKLTKEKQAITMPAPNAGFLQNDQNAPHGAFRQTDQNALHESFRPNDQNGPHIGFHQSDRNAPRGPATASASALPPWMASSSNTTTIGPPASPSVTLTLSPLRGPPVAAAPPIPWLQPEVTPHGIPSLGIIAPVVGDQNKNPLMVSELVECCRELEEGHRAWAAHRKEADWRLKRVELQLESEKACKRREKMEEIEAKVKALREQQKASLDRIEAEYREQLAGLRREAEVKEQKLAEQWAAKHVRLTRFLEQMGCRSAAASEPNGR